MALIIASEFISETGKGYLNGSFTLTNLNNYFLNASLKSSWDFEEINQYFEDSPFKNLQGKFTGNTNYNGNIAFDKRFKKMFIASTHNSTLKFENSLSALITNAPAQSLPNSFKN